MRGYNATDLLARGLQKYGELAIAGNNLENLLKKHSKSESMSATGITMEHLRRAIAACGNILEENSEAQFFIAVIPTGRMNATRALVAAVLQNGVMHFAAYAREGLIKQHLAKGAIDSIKKQIRISR